ncbi:MAG: GAF domain-containing sensor histidine kinase [Deltaproteobacteria bacterium]|nr:GAF domain-containing sensor histidine kinase [Deltaproteobacteria bacterium]
MLIDLENLVRSIEQEPWAREQTIDAAFWPKLMEWLESHVLSGFLHQVIHQVDAIIEIDPDLSEPLILEKATLYMVEFLGAQSASVRIYDPHTEQMLSYGSYPSKEEARATFIPLEGSIAGDVVKTRKPCLVPDIARERRYLDKEVISKRGVRSLMAIPLEISRFFPNERDTVGVIQIYYSEKERHFSSLEVLVATVMAKRLSYVIARKKINSLNNANVKKEAIVSYLFRTLGTRGGVKLEEIFNQVIPELADMVQIQSATLFSVSADLRHVVLDAGYPVGGYHKIGKSYSLESEPVFELMANLRDYTGDSAYEVVTPSYILVVAPQKSALISSDFKRAAAKRNINSILYIPLKPEGDITHFITLDALDQRMRYGDEEIEIFLFLGRELMKAQRMERLDDALHDFKNPAIATAGFARRLKKLIESDPEGSRDQILKYADILLEETSRLQELALSIYQVGKEQEANLSGVLRGRFEINREAIREQLKQNVHLEEGPFDDGLVVTCFVINLERVFDNLLNNATKAIPLKGGTLAIRTYRDGHWACAEISNTGVLPEREQRRILDSDTVGRGLYITQRIIRLLKGRLEIRNERGTTTFLVRLPRSDASEVKPYAQLSLLTPSDMG